MFIGFIVLTVCVIGWTPAFAQEESSPDGRILYVDTTEKDKTYLATILPDGTDKKRITPGYSNIVFPRMSEVRGCIGFTNKQPDMTSEVYILSKDGKKIQKVLENAAIECFSPDGKFVLYTTCDMNASLFAYSIEDKASVKLSDTLKITAADWSPKGDWIAASALAEDGTNDLWLISTKAQGFQRLTETPGVNESFPVFTADGKYLAFISNRHDESNEIEFLDIDKRALQRPLIKGMYPSLSPSNKWVSFEIGPEIGISRIDGIGSKVVTQGRTPCWIKNTAF